jgi:hypothetical protein
MIDFIKKRRIGVDSSLEMDQYSMTDSSSFVSNESSSFSLDSKGERSTSNDMRKSFDSCSDYQLYVRCNNLISFRMDWLKVVIFTTQLVLLVFKQPKSSCHPHKLQLESRVVLLQEEESTVRRIAHYLPLRMVEISRQRLNPVTLTNDNISH